MVPGMPRLARVVIPGFPHHVTQRGNRRMRTFFCDDDYRSYVGLIGRWCRTCGARVWAWCLMPNHVHLIVVPDSETALCRAVGEAHRRYTGRINFREGWRGHLWQGRFASFVMDEPHLLAAARTVERNPVKAKLVRRAEDWPWSSAAAHVSGMADELADSDWLEHRIAAWVCDRREYLADDDDHRTGQVLRRHENTGRPLGDLNFLRRASRVLGRDLLPKKPGPKPRTEHAS
jgi:putative transposase